MVMNDAKITAAFVVRRDRADGRVWPLGVLHIHDLLQFGLN
jgi:hypothetical protein